jgi:hypothetical protein
MILRRFIVYSQPDSNQMAAPRKAIVFFALCGALANFAVKSS